MWMPWAIAIIDVGPAYPHGQYANASFSSGRRAQFVFVDLKNFRTASAGDNYVFVRQHSYTFNPSAMNLAQARIASQSRSSLAGIFLRGPIKL